MPIVNINGNPYTSAAEDMRLMRMKHEFRELVAAQVNDAIRRAKDGRMQVHFGPIDAFLDQVYYAGRDAS